jgi:hypothetical protein
MNPVDKMETAPLRQLSDEEISAVAGGAIADDIVSAVQRVAFWAGAIGYATVALMAGMAKPQCQ